MVAVEIQTTSTGLSGIGRYLSLVTTEATGRTSPPRLFF